MTKSSRTRRVKARAKKYSFTNSTGVRADGKAEPNSGLPVLNKTDKRYLIAFSVLSFIITAIYFSMGGRNIFVFPALICISVGARKYWSGPIRKYADNA